MKIKRTKKEVSRYQNCITVKFSIPRPLWGKEEGRKFLDVLKKYSAVFWVDKYAIWSATGGNYKKIDISEEQLLKYWEPYWRKYHDASDVEQETIWVDKILLRRSKGPQIDHHINPQWMDWMKGHCEITMYFRDADWFTQNTKNEQLFWEFLGEIAEYAQCDFGSMQYTTAAEEKGFQEGKIKYWIWTHSSTTLIDYMPKVYFVNIFGLPYIELFGKEKILSAPCHLVQELKCGSIWLQLLPGLPKNIEDLTLLEDRKKLVIEHLNNNAFFDATLPPNHKYNVPKFDLLALKAPINLPKPKVVPWR